MNAKSFVYKWNNSFPLDRWWRKKHGIPFGSKKHRESSFIDQLIEYTEDVEFGKLKNSPDPVKYFSGTGDWLIAKEMAPEDIDNTFDEINLDNIK